MRAAINSRLGLGDDGSGRSTMSALLPSANMLHTHTGLQTIVFTSVGLLFDWTMSAVIVSTCRVVDR